MKTYISIFVGTCYTAVVGGSPQMIYSIEHQMPNFSSNGVTMSGVWEETFDNLAGHESVTLIIKFKTGGQKWREVFIQNYVSIEDQKAPGNSSTFTCNVEYKRD